MTNLTDALAARQALLDQATAGQTVTADQVQAVNAAVTLAQEMQDFAAASQAGTTQRQNQAAVATLTAQKQSLEATQAAAVAALVAAAPVLDAAMASARQALSAFLQAAQAASDARQAAWNHNLALPTTAATNPVLAALEPADMPKAVLLSPGPFLFGLQVDFTISSPRPNGTFQVPVNKSASGLLDGWERSCPPSLRTAG